MASVSSVRDKLAGWLRREPKVVTPRSILIVDGNTSDRRATAGRVTRLGYQALEASSAAEAEAQLEKHDPECILLAFDLPDAPELQALERIREMAPEVRVVMLAPTYYDVRAAEAMRHGAVAYLGKPFGQDDLRELLTRH